MKIAILDPRIQAPGLTKLFPESDYFAVSYNGGYDLNKTPEWFYNQYNFHYREDIESIRDDVYDILFIVYACCDFKSKKRKDVQHHLRIIRETLSRNTFKKVVAFANDDSYTDPSVKPYFNTDIWFKRNYQSDSIYSDTVYPFPFVMFGTICPLWRILKERHTGIRKADRVIWAGWIGKNGKRSKVRNRSYMTRFELMNSKMRDHITRIEAPNDIYMYAVTNSKYALDMNGEGDPNYRTFELLTADTLILQQKKKMIWPFENGDSFSEETVFSNSDEFISALSKLRSSETLYNSCLKNQLYIRDKYFQAEWLREYILNRIFKD